MKNGFLAFAAALAAFCVAACDRNGRLDTPPAPSIRLPAVAGRPGVGYFDVNVRGDQGALVSVTSPRIRRIEMHESMTSGTMTSMRPLPRVPINEDGWLVFAPGGRHLMLFEIDPGLRPGDQVVLTLNFARGAPRELAAVVESAGGDTH